MQLPFLKKKWPKVATNPMEEKSYGLSPSDMIEDHCINELMEAVASKDIMSFLKALEALVLNCFEFEEDQDAIDQVG